MSSLTYNQEIELASLVEGFLSSVDMVLVNEGDFIVELGELVSNYTTEED